MNIIKLDTIDSTNNYLKKLANSEEKLPNFLVVWTPNQTNGVGQYGAKWVTESFKNLTFSVLFLHKKFDLTQYFFLNMLTAIAVAKTIEEMAISNVKIKWPNDILLEKHKIGGILIENVIRGTNIEKSIIGIGLNINQTDFSELPRASSLQKITRKQYDIESVMKSILFNLQKEFTKLEESQFADIYPIYQKYLFQLNKISAFRPKNGKDFSGIIRGALPSGELLVETENEEIKQFALKEIQLLY
ncbi:biotin--[acetyl-CoA-carboxylase] ligase [Capnocytophaga cynodegmi]|uniref:Biotin-(Acetyl-CoA-carboxylase) ligase n=1 Tax=Capnocytophaga cynodegmi TaxID=28189 RepID=A0A0B7HQK6_9FLAO|nr:biotin--[acetyl-CoA-carboxylase] ligase [Capnocytophaga cynodegmi]GIM53482.1 biotin--[acetyl-CoA-carboxylase] ligase [Capnocytophaga cynodegmi]CEN40914.1 Biotin-(Acetyl-CoA-carboxylase) ligase [Capnocytophaga cynodegmi]CEN41020.1 Biotin-(Acetyl-CoA-carboxylase) ligase [Capnocytophaga cynodegmi]